MIRDYSDIISFDYRGIALLVYVLVESPESPSDDPEIISDPVVTLVKICIDSDEAVRYDSAIDIKKIISKEDLLAIKEEVLDNLE